MMLGQQVGTSTHLVYVDDYRVDWKEVGSKLGICGADGAPVAGNYIMEANYMNSNNVAMPAIKMDGKSLTVYVVDGIVGGVTDAPSLAKAMNHFHVPAFDFGQYKFAGKFTLGATAKQNIVYDKMNRGISFSEPNIKDLRGIYELMTKLDFDNGKFMEPLVNRYVYTLHQMPSRKNRGIPVIGYFDLQEYLTIMRDNRVALFHPEARTSALVLIEKGSTPGRVMLKDIAENGTAMLTIDGFNAIIDVKKANDFRPLVILSKTPFMLPESSHFPWHKIKFGKDTIFCTPMMSKMDMWEHVQGGVDLLSRMF